MFMILMKDKSKCSNDRGIAARVTVGPGTILLQCAGTIKFQRFTKTILWGRGQWETKAAEWLQIQAEIGAALPVCVLWASDTNP